MGSIWISLVPIGALSFPIAAIWLLYLGLWKIVVPAVIVGIVGQWIIIFLLWPGALFLALGRGIEAVTNKKMHFLIAAIIDILSTTYAYCVMAVWAFGSFYIFFRPGSLEAKVPLLLLSYAVATTPWNVLTLKDLRLNPLSSGPIGAFFHQVGVLSLVIYVWKAYPSPNMAEMLLWYGIPMAIGLLYHSIFLFNFQRRAHLFRVG